MLSVPATGVAGALVAAGAWAAVVAPLAKPLLPQTLMLARVGLLADLGGRGGSSDDAVVVVAWAALGGAGGGIGSGDGVAARRRVAVSLPKGVIAGVEAGVTEEGREEMRKDDCRGASFASALPALTAPVAVGPKPEVEVVDGAGLGALETLPRLAALAGRPRPREQAPRELGRPRDEERAPGGFSGGGRATIRLIF